jgi:hypothetical protein
VRTNLSRQDIRGHKSKDGGMGGFFLGFIGGVFAWIVTALVGQPIYHFISLRAEAARVLTQYERSDFAPGPDPADANWIAERRRAYRECGTRLVAFAAANVIVTRLLRSRFLGPVRCYPRSAGEALVTLGDLGPDASTRMATRDQVVLRLKLDFGSSRRN